MLWILSMFLMVHQDEEEIKLQELRGNLGVVLYYVHAIRSCNGDGTHT